MSENRFLSFVFIKGLLFLLTGICLLVLPKITSLSFGFMLCLAFMLMGGYEIINAFFFRNFSRHSILDVIVGLILFITGLILLFVPVFDVMIIISLIGIYFILKSISSNAFGIQTRKILSCRWLNLIISIIELFFGLVIIISIPTGALWLAGILTGIDFILSGFTYINMHIATNYLKEE